MIWILTSEHFGNKLIPGFSNVFEGHEDVLKTHRAYDIGSADMFQSFKALFDINHSYPYSRLIIEPNRSLHHAKLFSEFTKPLPKSAKTELIENYYLPYRNAVEQAVAEHINEGVVHIGVHSFTPDINGEDRSCPIGLLYDPKREAEFKFARLWKQEIKQIDRVRVRYNYPYKGSADGFTTYLRKQFPEKYIGIELEVRNDATRQLTDTLASSIVGLKSRVSTDYLYA